MEWLNVSGGLDAAPDFSYTRNELIRGGYAWGGVSAQSIGVEGGAVAVPIKIAIDAGAGIDIAGTIGGAPTKLRTDLAAPILVVETETDLLGVLNYQPASQPDSARLRVWEMAGTAHADTYIIGTIADQIGCAAPANSGPGHFMVAAALHHLDVWVRDGTAPPKAPRLKLDATPAFVRDQYGIAEGGIRTPLVDVPVDTLSGESAGGSIACILFGSTQPLTAEQLSTRYRSRQDYLDQYRAAADASIKDGFVLAADRAELLAAAQPSRIAG